MSVSVGESDATSTATASGTNIVIGSGESDGDATADGVARTGPTVESAIAAAVYYLFSYVDETPQPVNYTQFYLPFEETEACRQSVLRRDALDMVTRAVRDRWADSSPTQDEVIAWASSRLSRGSANMSIVVALRLVADGLTRSWPS